MTAALSASEARRVAIAAQGLARPRPRGRIDIRHLRRVFNDVSLVQIDSVNVVARSHRLPLFSRLGTYPRELLDDAVYRRRELFEYWGHAASLIPTADHRLYRWRMERVRRGETGGELARFAAANDGYVDAVATEIRERGPLSAGDLSDPGSRSGPWWGWADGKSALEWLFAIGTVSVAARRAFERVYDLTERVIPAAVLEEPAPDETDAVRALMFRAVDALGIATATEIADYHRTRAVLVRDLLAEAVDAGELVEIEVEGWGRRTAYARPDLAVPRTGRARALLSPFDSLIWHRDRTERLFGFVYRLEIYVPAERREYGYYVLPFLLGEDLVARFDLKADRKAGRLLVRGAYVEPGEDGTIVAEAAAEELSELARWRDLEEVAVGRRGDLARDLRRAV
jgi:uncharacterized protein